MQRLRGDDRGIERGTMDWASFLRTRLFDFYVLVMSLGIGLSIVLYFRWTRKPKQVRWLLRCWSRCFVGGARWILGVRYRIEGLEHVPPGPVIYAGNHQSYWESIFMTVLVPDINVVTKRASMSIPVFGWGLRHAPMIPVDRDAPGRNIRRLLREGRASVRAGRSLLIFPEGGRVQPGMRRPFQRGIANLYETCGVPIAPFVTDAGHHWPAGFAVKRPGEIRIRFLPPFPAGRPQDRVAAELETLLNSEKDKLMAETAGARASLPG